jgi:hypothetical protein
MSNQPQRHARYRPSLYRAPARVAARPPGKRPHHARPGQVCRCPAAATMNEPSLRGPARSTTPATCRNRAQRPGSTGPCGRGAAGAHAVSTRLKARLTGPTQTAHSRYRLTRSPSLRTVTAPGRYFPFAGRAAAPAGPSRLPPLLVARAVSDSCSDVGRPLLRLRSLVVRRGLTAMARRLAASPGWLNTPQVLLVIVGGPAPLWPGALLVDTPADPSP